MFKEAIIKNITGINDKMLSVGQNSFLAISLGAFNSTLYGYILTIMKTVVMPIAYVILALFFVLELWKISTKVESAGGSSNLGVELVFKALVRMVLCKVAVDQSLLFMEAIYDVFLSITKGIAGVMATPALVGGMDVASLTAEVNNMGIGEQLSTFNQTLLICGAIKIILGIVDVMCIARFIEIYVYIAIAPIPIATFPSDDLNIAKNFLKSFAAVCLQGALIYLILSIFPMLFNANILGDTGLFGMLIYAITLGLAVFFTSRWAKSVCNAG